MEVIDKNEYISKIEVVRILQKAYAEGRIQAKDGCTSVLDDINAADVQPVIHAKWILFDRDSVGRAFYCSNCRKVTTTDDYEDTPLDRDEYFCMRCGADMRSPDATKG